MVEVDSARPPGTSSRQPRPSLDAPPRKSRFTENLPGAPKEEGDPTARTATTDEERSTVSPPLSVKLPPEVQTTKSSPVKTPERSRLSPSSSPKKTPVDKGSSKRPPVLTPASADDSSDGGQRTASSVESGRGERGRKRDKISQGTEGEEEPPVGTPRRRLPSESSNRPRPDVRASKDREDRSNSRGRSQATAQHPPPPRSSQSAGGSQDRTDPSRRPSSSSSCSSCSSWSCCCSSPCCGLSNWRGWSWIRVHLPYALGLTVAVLMVGLKLTGPISGIWYCQVGDTTLGGLGYCQG